MVSLVDIIPQTRTVQIAGGEVELRGLGLRQIANLLMQFPTLRNLLVTQGSPEIDPDTLIVTAPEAVGAIIAEAAGQPEAAERIADGALSIADMVECLVVIRDLTLGRDPGPFLERLRTLKIIGNGLDGGAYGRAADTSAPLALSN